MKPRLLSPLGVGLAFAVTTLLLPAPPAGAQRIMLQPQATLMLGASPLDPGDYAIPCVTDWNGDGRKDLLVGYRSADKIACYLNRGTDAAPLFTNFFHLQAGGVDIYQAGTSCGAPAPWVCDYDGDGRRDLLVGNGANGQVFLYANTNTDALPILAPGVALRVGAATLSVGARATPYMHDWDADGLPDLLCGDYNGYANFFKNIGTRQAPAYAAAVRLLADGLSVNFNSRSVLRVLDWDGDGRKDLVGSGISYLGWCRNTGDNAAPVLEAKQALTAPVNGQGLTAVVTGNRMRLDVADWNADGVPDVLIGDTSGRVYLYAGYRFTLNCPEPAPGGDLVLSWCSAPYLKYDLLGTASLTLTETPLATGILSAGVTTRWTNVAAGARQFYRVRLAP